MPLLAMVGMLLMLAGLGLCTLREASGWGVMMAIVGSIAFLIGAYGSGGGRGSGRKGPLGGQMGGGLYIGPSIPGRFPDKPIDDPYDFMKNIAPP